MRRKHLVDKLRFNKHERQEHEVSEEQNWYNVKALRNELKYLKGGQVLRETQPKCSPESSTRGK